MPEFNILIGLSGSVATIKITELVNLIRTKFTENNRHVNIRLIFTEKAMKFVNEEDIVKLQQMSVVILEDHDEWYSWKKMGDRILHTELRKWADLLLIAPLSANTMGKLANGLCDNLLTCVARAWDTTKPLIFCPAMNTYMWDHPITKRQIEELVSFKYELINPTVKRLACGDFGCGAMAPTIVIAEKVYEALTRNIH